MGDYAVSRAVAPLSLRSVLLFFSCFSLSLQGDINYIPTTLCS